MNKPDDQTAKGNSIGGPLMIVGILLIVGAFVAMIAFRSLAVMLTGLGVGAVVFVIGAIITATVTHARNEQARVEFMKAKSLKFKSFKKGGDKDEAFAPFDHLSQLTTGAKGLAWIARPTEPSKKLTLFEHAYVVSTGQTTVRVAHTVAADACPEAWPTLTVAPESFAHKIAGLFGKHDLQLESDEFNKRWHVQTDDEEFATVVLSTEMQAWMLQAPRTAAFQIGEGWIIAMHKKALKPDQFDELLELLDGFRTRIPSELDAWMASE